MATASPSRRAARRSPTPPSYVAANRLAHAILAGQDPGPAPVALLLDQGLAAVVAMMGVLKAGKPSVAVDPGHPPARSRHILDDVEAALLLTDSRHAARARELATRSTRLLEVDDPRLALPDEPPEVLDLVQVGVRDSFLDLGGHSLLASRIAARVTEALAVDIPMRALFEASTVEAMARLVTEQLACRAGADALGGITVEQADG